MTQQHPDHLRTRESLRTTRRLLGGYLVLSAATFVAIVVLRNHAGIVTPAVWVRGTIVTASSVLTFVFAAGAARGSRRAYLRLRIVSAAMVVAIAVIISLPGVFPLWMRIEQAACGLLLAGVVAIINRRRVRWLFAG